MFSKGLVNIVTGFLVMVGGFMAGTAWLAFCFGSVIIGILLLLFAPQILFFPFQVSLFGFYVIRDGCNKLTEK